MTMISIDKLEPLIEKIETISRSLDQYLLGCVEFGHPPRGFCGEVRDELRNAPDLLDWLEELRQNKNR